MEESREEDARMDFVEQEATSSLDASGDKAMPIQWTDEKHGLYLKSMEASFVDQLYNSMGWLGGHWRNGHNSATRSSKSINHRMADKFKVHQNGSWRKFSFGGDEPMLEEEEVEHRRLLSSPWIRRFTSGHRQEEALMTPQESIASGSKSLSYGIKISTRGSEDIPMQFSPCSHRQCSTYGNEGAEASGQNFVDEDEEEEDEDEAYESAHMTKRPKISEFAPSRSDKVKHGFGT